MATVKVADLLVAITADAKGFKAEMAKVADSMKQSGQQMASVGGKLSMNVSLPLLGIGVAAAKMARDFEHSFTMMRTLVGLTAEEMEGWEEKIKDTAALTGRNSRELAEAMFFITSAGLRGAVALKTLEASAKGAALGMGETKTIAFATVSAVNAYGVALEDVDKVVAQLMMTVRYGNLEASTLAPVLGAVIPVASELSVGLDQVGAALAAMTRLGVDTHMAATSLKQILMTILKPTDQAKEALKNVGLSAQGLREELREKGLLSVLGTLRGAMASNEEGLATVFDNVRALTGVLNLMGKNAATTEMIFEGMAKTIAKDLGGAFEVVSQTKGMALNRSLVQLNDAMMTLGDTTLPVLVEQMTRFSNIVGKASTGFDGWGQGAKDAAVDLGLLLIVLGPGMKVLGMFWRSVAATVRSLGALGAAINIIRVPLSGLGGLMTGAIGATGTLATTIGLLSSAAAAFAGILGWQVGRYIDDLWTKTFPGWSKMLGRVADQHAEFAAQLMDDEEVWEMTYNSYEKMREKVGATGDEFYISKVATKESTEQMAKMLPVLTDMVNKHNDQAEALKKVRENKDALDKEADAQAETQMRLADEYLQKLRETYDVMTKADILKVLADRTQHYKDMVKLQIEEKDLRAGMTPLLIEEMGLLADYKVKWSELPEETRKMLTELGKFSPELQTQINKVGELGGSYESLFNDVLAEFTDPTRGVAYEMGDVLYGGFKKGITEGWNDGLDDVRQKTEVMKNNPFQIPAEVVVDWSQFMKVLADIQAGKLPPMGGGVP